MQEDSLRWYSIFSCHPHSESKCQDLLPLLSIWSVRYWPSHHFSTSIIVLNEAHKEWEYQIGSDTGIALLVSVLQQQYLGLEGLLRESLCSRTFRMCSPMSHIWQKLFRENLFLLLTSLEINKNHANSIYGWWMFIYLLFVPLVFVW